MRGYVQIALSRKPKVYRSKEPKELPIVCGVYCLTDKLTGLMYIGSSRHIYRRFQAHTQRTRKVGVNKMIKDMNFISRHILQVCDGDISTVDLRRLEAEWINRLNTQYPSGCNKINPQTNKRYKPNN